MSKGGYRQINKALNICAFEDYIETQQTRLPKIEDVEQISPRVLRVLGQNAGKVASRRPAAPLLTNLDHHHRLTAANLPPSSHSREQTHTSSVRGHTDSLSTLVRVFQSGPTSSRTRSWECPSPCLKCS
jgi:hypothetical protein